MRWLPILLSLCVLAAGCKSESDEPVLDADAGVDSAADMDADSLDGAQAADQRPDAQNCAPLFGMPNERSGVGSNLCSPTCACGEGPNAQAITDADVTSWFAWTLANPPDALTADPYEQPPPSNEGVCVAVFDPPNGTYELTTMETAGDIGEGVLTHAGACGVCSSLADLAAYVRNPDLTDPVRECGLLGIREGEAANVQCLEDLGFTGPCAQIWYYNTLKTRTDCLAECITLRDAPYLTDAGELNDCLACDEEMGGPVFQAVAGRSRRNSGLASAICRPCETVADVTHAYPTP